MGNACKKSGGAQMFPEQWKELAKNPKQLSKAREEYMRVYPKCRLVDAHKAVLDFYRQYKQSQAH